jgi:hypothetical protein
VEERRPPGSDAERRAASALERRLRELGREAHLEAIDVWPRRELAHLLHALLALAGSLIAVDAPVAGTIVVGAATISALIDLLGLEGPIRRLTGRRASQNVVSPEDGGKPGRVILVAHLDTGRRVRLFSPSLFAGALLLVLACCVARVAGLDGDAVTAVQFVPTVALILAVPVLLEAALAEGSRGESGAETVLALAKQQSLERFDLWVVLTGGAEASARGLRSFLRRHRRELERDRTVLIEIEPGAADAVRFGGSHPQLIALCTEVAEDAGADTAPVSAGHDAAAASARRYAAVTIRGDSAAFCAELITRLDASA